MHQPELYAKSSLLTKRDAREVLNEFVDKMCWNKYGERIIDVGCADGGITANIYNKYIPTNYLKIIGCDVNNKMIKYATDHNSDEKTKFVLLDIEKELPIKHERIYNHVFAFYILHWVKDRERVFRNFFNLLDDDGECLVTGLAQMPFFDAYRAISRTKKWKHYLSNVEDYVCEYHDCLDPVPIITGLMEGAGFKDIEVDCKSKIFVFETVQDLKDLLRAVNAFDVPQDKLDDYFEDMVQIILKDKIMTQEINQHGKTTGIKMNYRLIIAFGRK